jgi:magnesium transporter
MAMFPRRLIRQVRRLTRLIVPATTETPGASPGTVVPQPEAPPPTLDVIGYGPHGFEEKKGASLEDCEPFLTKWPCVWIDVSGLGDAALIERIGERFGIHGLTLEDVANTSQRAKVEDFDDYLYVVCRSAELTEQGLFCEQMSLIVARKVLISFQEMPGDCFGPVRERLRQGRGRMRTLKTDYLAYALLDAVVDSYFPVVEKLGDELDELEDRLLQRCSEREIAQVHAIKRDLLVLRRSIWPHREAFAALVRDGSSLISKETKTFLRDAYDHVIQITDIVETYREVCADLRELYLSEVSNRMNEVMKLLTIISTIFIPLTFLVGVYGMNFDVFPELHWPHGYMILWFVMIGIAIAMVAWFVRNGWIGRRK